jgi:hypothetical protein
MRATPLRSPLALASLLAACGGVAPEPPPGDAGAFGDAAPSADAAVIAADAGAVGADASVQDASAPPPPPDGGAIAPSDGAAPIVDGGSVLPGTGDGGSASGPDAGVFPPPPDAGAPRLDASLPPIDGGVTPPLDAGAPPFDAGAPPIDAGPPATGPGARVVFVHASPNYGSFGLCVGVSGVPFVADTVKFPDLNAPAGTPLLQVIDTGTVSGPIPQAAGASNVIGYDQLTNSALANAKIEYWGIKNATQGTSCRTLVGANAASPNANARKLGELPYASLKSGGAVVAALVGCVTSGGTKVGSQLLCGPDFSFNAANLRMVTIAVPSARVASGSIGASFVHLSSSASGLGLASTTFKALASGGGTSGCPYRLTNVGTASYLTASPIPSATFGGGTLLGLADVSAQAQFGFEGIGGTVCGNLYATPASTVAFLSSGSTDLAYFTQQTGKSMVFMLVGDATVPAPSPSNPGSWNEPFARILAFPTTP